MCILFIARNQSIDYPLIIAANRDEFHKRPTLTSHLWNTSPQILAGKDEEGGGTWMGVTPTGKIAALTNIRDPLAVKPNAPSRGDLTCDWLQKDVTIHQYHKQLQATREQYNGYNLVFGDTRELWVYNNATNNFYKLDDGIFGLSNADIHTPWPKTHKGTKRMAISVSQSPLNPNALFELLYDTSQAADNALPKTGVGYDWEKRLSSIFITSPEYGTRASTLLTVDRQGVMHWHEKTFNSEGKQTHEETYVLNPRV